MPKFPQATNEILALAGKIARGIADNPVDYPNPPFDASLLGTLAAEAMQDITHEVEVKAEAYAAGCKRRKTVALVAKEMRRLLAQAQIVHGESEPKLEEIGWKKRAHPKSLAPGQVRNLRVLHQGAGTVNLEWTAPEVTAHTGKVNVYFITREIYNETTRELIEAFGTWSATSYKTKTELANQPRGVEINYRVTASNVNGEGQPSNTEQVVL